MFAAFPRPVRLCLLITISLLATGPTLRAQTRPDSLATAASGATPRRTVYELGRYGTWRYERPRLLAPLRDTPADFWHYARYTAHQRSLPALGMVAVSTAVLIALDQPLVDGARHTAEAIGLDHSSAQVTLAEAEAGPVDLAIRYPASVNSALYWLGEGSPSLLVAGGFWVSGLVGHDNRRLSVASQLFENTLITGVLVQALKRSTGRESPRVSTERGGRWDFFPNPAIYQKHVPRYDAFPSGHLTTLAATVTTLAENFPEHRWIYPVGGALVGTVGFVMMNTGVHWAGDYPVALAVGYSFARFNVRRHRTRLDAGSEVGRHRTWPRPDVFPTVLPGGGTGLAATWRW